MGDGLLLLLVDMLEDVDGLNERGVSLHQRGDGSCGVRVALRRVDERVDVEPVLLERVGELVGVGHLVVRPELRAVSDDVELLVLGVEVADHLLAPELHDQL